MGETSILLNEKERETFWNEKGFPQHLTLLKVSYFCLLAYFTIFKKKYCNSHINRVFYINFFYFKF